MANQKAELHSIPLKTLDVCLNKYDHDIKPYEGFRKNNSPFYGNLLSPFYKKDTAALDVKSYVNEKGVVYTVHEGSLAIVDKDNNKVKLNTASGNKYVIKEDMITSGNASYPTILAFFQETNTYSMLCASSAGRIAIVNADGTLKWSYTSVTYYPSEKIHFAEHYGDSYCFTLGNQVYVTKANNSITSLYNSPNMSANCSFGCVKSENYYVVCRFDGSSTTVHTIHNSTLAKQQVTTVKVIIILPTVATYTRTGTLDFFFNRNGDVVFYGNNVGTFVYNNTSSNEGYIQYPFGYGVSVDTTDASGATIKMNASTSYISSAGVMGDNIVKTGLLYYNFDNYTARAVIGKWIGWVDTYSETFKDRHNPEITMYTRQITTVVDSATCNVYEDSDFVDKDINIQKITNYSSISRTGDLESVSEFENVRAGVFFPMYVDANNNNKYYNIPISIDGSYLFGSVTRLSNGTDNVRLLYKSNVLQGLSVYPQLNSSADNTSVGSLLTMVGSISSDYPISLLTSSAGSLVFFANDKGEWQKVTISTDASKATMKVLNNRYLLTNVIDYYNCYDTVGNRWYHFGSDWINQDIHFSYHPLSLPEDTSAAAMLKNNLVAKLESYINICKKYYFASGQAVNYMIQQTPFISTLLPPHEGYCLGQDTDPEDLKVFMKGGATADNFDIDVYFSDEENFGTYPQYKYSLDDSGRQIIKYINQSLADTTYTFTLTLVPSIFSDFISGFVNQGIILDSGRSYIQTFAENYRPVYAVDIKDQLEGIQNAFTVQGQYFVIIGNSIYRYSKDEGSIYPIVEISGMQYIGNNPYVALFWSNTNKTLYRFSGDNMLSPFTQADEVSTVLYSTFNPNTLSIYIITDASILIVAQDYLVKIPNTDYYKCYPLECGCALVGETNTRILSYNKMSSFDVETIELETECYGLGNSVKSVNDCVYVRLFDEDMKEGVVKVSSETLNETSKIVEEKVFNITKDKWDKNSKTIFLRYQPKYQAATGFSVKIKSPFAIASLQISAQPETVQNSKYNI